MKLAIMGASVTAQSINHSTKEVTGYSEVLRIKYEKCLKISDFQRFVYPGNRFSDAGLIKLEDIIKYQPTVCLIEPIIEDYSRGSKPTPNEIRYFYFKLLEHNIYPITVYLTSSTAGYKAFPNYPLFNEFLKKYQLPVIENIKITTDMPVEDMFIGIHTTILGAEFYAKKIYEYLLDHQFISIKKITARLKQENTSPFYIKKLAIPKNQPFREIVLKINSIKGKKFAIRIVQSQKIGMYSPVLDVHTTLSETNQKISSFQISVWDGYCHYERGSFVTLYNDKESPSNEIKISITCSLTPPKYNECRREITEWPNVSELYLNPEGPLLFITTEEIEVTLLNITLQH